MKPAARKLPSYTDYLIERCASLYLLLQPSRNLYSVFATKTNYVDRVVSSLAANHMLVFAAKSIEGLVVETWRILSSTEVIESYTPSGYLDVAASSKNIAQFRPPVWRRVRRGPSPQERLCICKLLQELLTAANNLVNINTGVKVQIAKTYGIDITKSPSLKRMFQRTSRVREKLKTSILRECGHFANTKIRAHACRDTMLRRNRRLARQFVLIASILETLRNAISLGSVDLDVRLRNVDTSAYPIQHFSIRMMLDKLYELYTLYIVLKALMRLGEVRNEDSVIIVEVDGGINLFYNSRPRANGKPLSRIALGESTLLSRDELEKLSGIPDITLVVNNKVKVVIEVKHSINIGYLSLARFKTIAYIHEYDADAGILIYPGISSLTRASKYELLEEEYAATQSVLERAEENGYLTLRLKDNASLYVVPLPPYKSREDDNISKIYMILSSIIESKA